MEYMYISSTDSLNYHPANSTWDFTIELPRILSGCLHVALSDIKYTASVGGLIVCSDICKESYIKDGHMPILRRVSEPGEIDRLQFVPITRTQVQRFRIYVFDNKLEVPADDIEQLQCTLIFKDATKTRATFQAN